MTDRDAAPAAAEGADALTRFIEGGPYCDDEQGGCVMPSCGGWWDSFDARRDDPREHGPRCEWAVLTAAARPAPSAATEDELAALHRLERELHGWAGGTFDWSVKDGRLVLGLARRLARPAPPAAVEGADGLGILFDAMMVRHTASDGRPYLVCRACACASPMVAPSEQKHSATCAVTLALAARPAPPAAPRAGGEAIERAIRTIKMLDAAIRCVGAIVLPELYRDSAVRAEVRETLEGLTAAREAARGEGEDTP